MREEYVEAADGVMRCAQLAAALEVCGWPKPGNVHRTADFPETRFEHFIAGSIALGPTMRKGALRGVEAGLGRIGLNEIGVGELVMEAVSEVSEWHRGGNTHLGISLLFTPLSAAAGFTYVKGDTIVAEGLRRGVIEVMKGTTCSDAREAYKAILSASSAALGRLEGRDIPDLRDGGADKKLIEGELTLYDVMKASSGWDNISSEWASGMRICFETGYPTICRTYQRTGDPNTSIVQAFLTIMAKYPDTFIARKVGVKKKLNIEKAVERGLKETAWISEAADKALRLGGLTTEEGSKFIQDFDNKLQARGGLLNPGTSADLTASSLMIFFLCGSRF